MLREVGGGEWRNGHGGKVYAAARGAAGMAAGAGVRGRHGGGRGKRRAAGRC